MAVPALSTQSNITIGINYGARDDVVQPITAIINMIVIDASGDDCRIYTPWHPIVELLPIVQVYSLEPTHMIME